MSLCASRTDGVEPVIFALETLSAEKQPPAWISKILRLLQMNQSFGICPNVVIPFILR
ncbi:hypothetical protein CLV44_116120 [Marinobacterium halophilum]|uniref:Uncharacterized protein n=1 Tax=Marinobacterium halophilum TaxID=267374 RepID=A0A2P8ETG1_9GAMM|nr:hypothetical protein CLV44_116120 [Marinobacterium halophilum]